jgi:adenosylmethionine-8-amino-7-oxononanoate aminotransferase
MTDFWHPFADMGAVEQTGALTIVKGEGAYVYDADGRRYFDSSGALWYCNVGHGRTELAEAAAAQMQAIAAFSNFADLATEPTEALATRVAELAPMPNAKVFFTSGGGEAVETAGKLALRYWVESGHPAKRILISRTNAYHGSNGIGTGIGGIAPNRDGYERLIPDWREVAWDDAGELERTIEEAGADRIAAFFCEPVMGAGGVHAPPEGYLDAVGEICRRHNVLFIVDEVITAFGRLGEWFASNRFGLAPDLVTCAKGISSGYVPLGAVVASERVWEPFFKPGAGMWRHGYTYSGHATAAAVALANLDLLEREELIPRGRELEGPLADALRPLAEHPGVDEVRAGTGLMAAVALSAQLRGEDPAWANTVVVGLRERGVISRLLADGSLQISPALVATEADFELLANAITETLDTTVAPAPAG